MNIGDICNRVVVCVGAGDTVLRAAELMRGQNVGCLVVVEPQDGGQAPVGIVTDRDLVIEVMAKGTDPESLMVEEIMSEDPLVVEEGGDVDDVLDAMQTEGIRRVPVVNDTGALVGILVLDDLLRLFATEIGRATEIAGSQRALETEIRD